MVAAGWPLAVAAFIAIALAAALTPSPASAETDLTGTWTFFFPKDTPTFFCPDMEITQAGPDLTLSSVDCFDGGEIIGGFDKPTRNFVAGGCPTIACVFMVGTVAKDGNTITGASGVPRNPAGSFGAFRNSSVTPAAIPAPVGGIAFDPDLGPLAGVEDAPLAENVGSIHYVRVFARLRALAIAVLPVAAMGALWWLRRRT